MIYEDGICVTDDAGNEYEVASYSSKNNNYKIVVITQEDYDRLQNIDQNTLYVIEV